MSETITLQALDLSGETLTMFLRKSDGTLLNTGGDAMTESGSTGVFTATLGESRTGLGPLAVRICAGSETADNLLYDGFLSEGSTVIDSAMTAELDSASVNAVADQVWDEAYADHNTAGSFGKLLNTIRKANLTIDGTVSNAITPTTLTFSSNVVATTSAYAHAVLLFTTGPLAGENSPIISYDSTNGVFLLEEPLTAAPSNGDEFVVIAGSHVHSVADIQSGLATAAALAAESGKITNIENASGYLLAVLAGACADPQTASETYAITVFGSTFTVDMAGQTSTGTRTAPTLTKT
jgi:hypothetical protein